MSSEPESILALVQAGRYFDVLSGPSGQGLIRQFVVVEDLPCYAGAGTVEESGSRSDAREGEKEEASKATATATTLQGENQALADEAFAVGTAALNAFLQINVTGPVPDSAALRRTEDVFVAAYSEGRHLAGPTPPEDRAAVLTALRRAILTALTVDGVATYQFVRHLELFGLARYLLVRRPGKHQTGDDAVVYELGRGFDGEPARCSAAWAALRVHSWHYRLLVQPSLGPGSGSNKSTLWSDVPNLAEETQRLLEQVEANILVDGDDAPQGRATWTASEKVEFLLEKANLYIIFGMDAKAKEALQRAAELNEFVYALSGALGKKTRFQERSTSQLVVLARSRRQRERVTELDEDGSLEAKPLALPLDDDTLLENVEFSEANGTDGEDDSGALPAALKGVSPDSQPRLLPLDQIILLTEATLKDAFSPMDSLTSEQILPFATRVVSDGPTNWQIYTQALLVRSRIEIHRSRTVERGVLQMQALVDQIIAETSPSMTSGGKQADRIHGYDIWQKETTVVPTIELTAPDGEPSTTGIGLDEKPTSFFPASKSSESAPPQARLQYIHALASPLRWHLESELAYSWVGIGSLVAALEIFKRLNLWAEVALCLASSAAAGDQDGRGSGGEEKAKAVIRWQLFHQTGTAEVSGATTDQEPKIGTNGDATDISDLKTSDFTGPERIPAPPNAARLYCILGDLESDPSHYERAWEISNYRYARAQKSLGEHYLQQKDWNKARDAYQKAVAVNRLSPDLWSRLGDISLRLGNFADAAEAFGRAIASAGDVVGGEDARTWSNLGSALWSMYAEIMEERRRKAKTKSEDGVDDIKGAEPSNGEVDVDEAASVLRGNSTVSPDPARLLAQSLAAYKRGASITHDNWRIWDNIITIASRMRPPAVAEIVHAMRRVIAIRRSEESLDVEMLRLVLNEAVLSKLKPPSNNTSAAGGASAPPGVYNPPRGSVERAVCDFLETEVTPLITSRSELWELVTRERVWRRDYARAVEAAEKAWRAATGGTGGGTTLAMSSTGAADKPAVKSWLDDKEAWAVVVERTDELVSVLENYGPEVPSIETRWKSRAKAAVRSVLGRAKASWEGGEGWVRLQGLLDGLVDK